MNKRTDRTNITINFLSGNRITIDSSILGKCVVIVLLGFVIWTLAISGKNADVLANIIRSLISIAQSM